MSQKTRKSMASRFKLSATGKVLRRKPSHRHLLRKKTVSQKRRMLQDQGLGAGQARQIRVGLPFA